MSVEGGIAFRGPLQIAVVGFLGWGAIVYYESVFMRIATFGAIIWLWINLWLDHRWLS